MPADKHDEVFQSGYAQGKADASRENRSTSAVSFGRQAVAAELERIARADEIIRAAPCTCWDWRCARCMYLDEHYPGWWKR